MNLWRLAARGLWFHRRTNLAVVLGVAVAAAVLTGALAVGDSVRHSLHQMAVARLGKIELALAPHERLFRAQLASDVGRELKATAAPVLMLPGTAVAGDGAQRANRVQVCGVDAQFWKLGGIENPAASGVVLNERLAQQLRVKVGSEVVLRVEKP
jgi:putative ABC transport system permease protein